MKPKDNRKHSLTERLRQITSAAMVAGSLMLGGTAQASVTGPSSVVDRAVAVQDALKKKVSEKAQAKTNLPRAQVLLAQWGNNWGNIWNNWDNWNNWHNWVNWGNWANWGNF